MKSLRSSGGELRKLCTTASDNRAQRASPPEPTAPSADAKSEAPAAGSETKTSEPGAAAHEAAAAGSKPTTAVTRNAEGGQGDGGDTTRRNIA